MTWEGEEDCVPGSVSSILPFSLFCYWISWNNFVQDRGREPDDHPFCQRTFMKVCSLSHVADKPSLSHSLSLAPSPPQLLTLLIYQSCLSKNKGGSTWPKHIQTICLNLRMPWSVPAMRCIPSIRQNDGMYTHVIARMQFFYSPSRGLSSFMVDQILSWCRSKCSFHPHSPYQSP